MEGWSAGLVMWWTGTLSRSQLCGKGLGQPDHNKPLYFMLKQAVLEMSFRTSNMRQDHSATAWRWVSFALSLCLAPLWVCMLSDKGIVWSFLVEHHQCAHYTWTARVVFQKWTEVNLPLAFYNIHYMSQQPGLLQHCRVWGVTYSHTDWSNSHCGQCHLLHRQITNSIFWYVYRLKCIKCTESRWWEWVTCLESEQPPEG